jgi:hypothetical protein
MKKMNGRTPEHIRKFVSGEMTARETHIAALNKPCEQCGRPASVRLRVLVLLDELVQRNPELVAQIMVSNPDGSCTVPTIPTKYGPMVKVSDIGACDSCRSAAEIAAAKCPSWCLVEISAPPEDKNPVLFQVPEMPGKVTLQ